MNRRSIQVVIDEKEEEEEQEEECLESKRGVNHRPLVSKGQTVCMPIGLQNRQSPSKPKSDEKKRPPTPFFHLKPKNHLVEKR